MIEVILKPLYHREQECIGIYFQYDSGIQAALQKTGAVKFSATNKCWYVPLSKENYNKIFFALKGLVVLEKSALHRYLADKKKESNNGITVPLVIPKKTDNNTLPEKSPQIQPGHIVIYKQGKIPG